MPLGFIVAALVANVAHSAAPSSLSLLVGFVLVGIPALDTCLVIVSRRRRHVSILTGGQDHLTHRTRARMMTARRVVLVLGSAQALLSSLVIFASRESSVTLVYIVLAFIVCAAVTIVALEQSTVVASTGAIAPIGADDAVPRQSARSPRRELPALALALLGVGAGVSALFSAYYDSGVWIPIGLGLVVVAASAAIARPPGLTRPVVLTLGGLSGLGLWSLLSGGWAQAVEQTTTEANLWFTYAALFLLLVVLIRRPRHATVLLAAVGAGIAIVAVSVLVRLLGGDPGTLFIGGRLNSPLGYVNGQACVFAMGCWLGLALAERREPVLAGVGAASAVALGGLTLLSQSRGAAIATLAAIVVALVVIPGARRRLLALTLIGAGIAAASGSVLHVYSVGQTGLAPASAVHSAAAAIIASAAGAGIVWALVVWAERALGRRGGAATVMLRRCATAAAAAVLIVPAGVALVRASSIEHTVSTQWHAFVHLSDATPGQASTGASTRLLSGAGNRYDYWRIAWHVFTGDPVAGVGAGNYTDAYFRERHTQEAIQNPHSLELQVLSELGLVGGVLLALLLGGVALGARRLRAAARSSPGARTTMVAATGIAVVWLTNTSGDWMHLLPGVTAIALAAAAVLCRGLVGAGETAERSNLVASRGRASRFPSLAAAAAVAFVLAVGGASLLRAGLTRHYLDTARADLAKHPAAAIASAGKAIRLDSANLDAYYVRAAGFARFNNAAAARATLLKAVQQDPGNFVTWTLLGDLEVRAGHLTAAKQYYGRAHQLVPNDPAVARLATDPASALGGAGTG
jgi:hypothetical protein